MALSLDRWVGKVAVVTGASSGIGAAITEQLVKNGVQVAALARRKNLLDELEKKLSNSKGKLYPIQTDMSKEEDIINAFKWIKEHLGPVHILVNNAGAKYAGKKLSDGDTETWRQIFAVNVIGLSIATREAIKDMRANNVDGHIIHINSILGHKVTPAKGVEVYPASKHAVTALAETLRLELNSLKSKIKISSVSPGLVNTDFPSEQSKAMMGENKLLDPEDVASAVLFALSTPPHVQIQELTVAAIGQP